MPDNGALYHSPQRYADAMAAYDAALTQWPIRRDSRFVETRFGPTHVIVAGTESAPPLFYFHGWNGHAAGHHHELDLSRLGAHFRLCFPDTIGQMGRSAPNRPPTNGPAYGEWVADVLDALNIDRTFVAGISGGGYLSLKIASHAPRRVLKDLVMSPAGMTPPAVNFKMLRAAFPAMLFPSPATAHNFVRALRSPQGVDSEASAAFERMICFMFKDFRLHRSTPDPLPDDELKRITAPVRLLIGTDDITWRVPQLIRRAETLIANIQVQRVPGAGHIMTLDKPGLAEAQMLDFFLGVGG